MTLTLEDVKNVRFPIAKRVGEGYRATEVDDFVDKVDLTFGNVLEENERLRAQLEALDGAAAPDPEQERVRAELKSENDELRRQLEQARRESAAGEADDAQARRLSQENEELKRQLEQVRGELEQARQSTGLTVMDGSGSKIEKIVVSTAAQASPAVTRLVQLATEQAESVLTEAEKEAERTVAEAERKAQELTSEASARAEKTQSEARVNADQLTSSAQAEAQRLAAEARANSDRVNTDVENRRRELFAKLEAERDQLVVAIDGLRTFEREYRSTMAEQLTRHLETVRNGHAEPAQAPASLDEARAAQGNGSSTPRLDALLAEGK